MTEIDSHCILDASMANESLKEGDQKRRKQASAEEKTAAVLRILKGEERAAVAGEIDVSPERLARWEKVFMSAGRSALAQSSQSSQSHRHRRKLSAGIMAAIAASILALALAGVVLYRIIFQVRVVPPPPE
jgi:transposase-like protein